MAAAEEPRPACRQAGNLDKTRDEPQRLQEALRLNQPLACAYYMKEDLRLVWEQSDKLAAKRVLDDWIRRAESSGIRRLIQFAHTLAAHRSGILNYYDHRTCLPCLPCLPTGRRQAGGRQVSSGPLEGTNTKIRVLQRQAYGFRDTEFFKLKIYALHETHYELVG